ncbi:MAG: DUF1788 domain-containing protein [Phycisphaerae bacterium]
MTDRLTQRLNAILPKLISEEFLRNSGIGNEIGFYIFEYPPQEELRVRAHIAILLDHLPKQKPGMRVQHVNLLDLLVEYLKSRDLLGRAIAMQREKGDQYLLKALEKVLDAERLAPVFAQAADPDNHDLILVSRVGSVWPLLRTHSLLNNLHSRMGKTPLVMFYPGEFDGRFLSLFGKKIKPSPYYRAFQLIP